MADFGGAVSRSHKVPQEPQSATGANKPYENSRICSSLTFGTELESPCRTLILKNAQERNCLRSQNTNYHKVDFGLYPLKNSIETCVQNLCRRPKEDKKLQLRH